MYSKGSNLLNRQMKSIALPDKILRLKKVLIISPHFPPLNTADMHRVRQSLPYFRQLGWEPVVMAVDEAFVESYSTDPLLMKTIPSDVEVHHVKAFQAKHTRKLGLGSLSMRAYWHMRKKGNELLRKQQFDLVYFSTTAFHVMALGPYWKRKFGVPFIVDIQDPWRNDFYLSKPKNERPPKFWIAYNIDKYLEAYTIPKADGIISVSKSYCETFQERYPTVKEDRCRVITFGASTYDVEVMKEQVQSVPEIELDPEKINLMYIGRGGHDMQFALRIFFKALAKGLQENPGLFNRLHCWFMGTSYAPKGKGKQTILPIAATAGVEQSVTEITHRLGYFDTLFLLNQADMLFVPGSTDTAYTASKIYPYLLMEKPLLALFYQHSSVVEVLHQLHYGKVIAFDHLHEDESAYVDTCYEYLSELILQNAVSVPLDQDLFSPYTALEKTREQVAFFEHVVANPKKA